MPNESTIFQYTQKIMTGIAKQNDEHIKKAMIDYAKEHSKEYGEQVELILLEEEKVKEIIELGIKEYLKQKRGVIKK